MKKTNAAIIGASGYSGEELIRLLTSHPQCNISAITSRKYAKQSVSEVFPRFSHSNLKFSNPRVTELAKLAEVVFLALPHGLAAEYAKPLFQAGLKVIDISADFRVRNTETYKKYYKTEHPAPEMLSDAVYGLPELYRDKIVNSRLIACAGCYPTSILLPLVPLLRKRLINPGNIVVASSSGVTGAGRKIDLPYIFPECNESFRAYAVSGHRHLSEIEQELSLAATEQVKINFIPHLAPMNRGINSTIIAETNTANPNNAIYECLKEFYSHEKFVNILSYGTMADTKNVTRTNQCEIGCRYDSHTGRIIITSAIDNLTKGASGQAIQCMNICCGFAEETGLT